ncbi:PAS/Protein phosphatase 2C-like protein [Actinokineospora spheciospongiae]|uniref:PAS/Protein phosphatase 2C-like protein n=2 Tax=Actinokineospora spheciospongiae TaxID=909613 RepID=W7IV67_9PSEU|nr:PAS/Protein phosphatase 2C-like protein [Actinokineospora spheciospongiae]
MQLDSPDPPSLGTVRDWSRRVLEGLDPTTLSDVELVITELATNAREHATGPRSVRLAREDHTIRVEVDDATPGSVPVERALSTSAHRGRGLLLVSKLCDCWGIHRHLASKTVWARLNSAG